jgi:predicted TIM-barrel fold metal-dependent hydrolase
MLEFGMMAKLHFFDSLSHPTLSGSWNGRPVDASFAALSAALTAAGYSRGCAVGLAGREGYQHAAFIRECRKHPALVPVAGIAPKAAADIAAELDEIRELGFRGIKLHPRFARIGYGDPRIAATFAAAAARDLPVFLCTYHQAAVDHYPTDDPLRGVIEALKAAPAAKVVLLHGGTVDLMRWAQFARHQPNILVDISFTIMRYRGSSVDLDIRWLFDGLQHRTCFGVDHPDYDHLAVRQRFDELSSGASPEARRNVAGLNLARLLKIELD